MNSVDMFIIFPILAGFVFGLFKGLIKELTSLAAIFLGIFFARLFSSHLCAVLVDAFQMTEKTSQPLAFLIIFVAIAVVLLIVARMLDKLFHSIALGGLNKLLGGVVGALKYALLVSVLINVFDSLDEKFGFISPDLKENALTYSPVMQFAPHLWEEAKDHELIKSIDFDKKEQIRINN